MTPEEISEINRKLAEWAGWTCIPTKWRNFWESPAGKHYPISPDYYRTNAAMDLLGVLVERGYHVRVQTEDWSSAPLWEVGIWESPEGDALVLIHDQSTIPAAICRACLGVIEREGEA